MGKEKLAPASSEGRVEVDLGGHHHQNERVSPAAPSWEMLASDTMVVSQVHQFGRRG